MEAILQSALVVPFVTVVAIVIFPRGFAELFSVVGAALATFFSVKLLLLLGEGGLISWQVAELVPGLPIAFKVDQLGITFALLASSLWILATIFSFAYVRANSMKHLQRYFACFALSIGAALGISFSANLLTFLIFFELLTFATYPLVVHKESDEAISAGRRYLAYSLTGGLLITAGIIWLWNVTDTIDFRAGGFVEEFSATELGVLFVLLISGCVVKAAVMPFHIWLPSAMVAPSPVSALLHAVAVVKAGVFGCLRMTGFVFKPELMTLGLMQNVMIFLTAATILCGSLMALRQQNLKKRLAYSTIVHLSYIVLGTVLYAQAAYSGAILHMVNHGLAKITLFLCAGAIYATTKFTEVEQLRGLGRKMPWTMAAFTVGSLGLIGIPGLCGFISKFYLVKGAVDVEQLLPAAIMLGASLLTAAYLLPIVYTAFFQSPLDDSIKETKPLTICAGLTVPLVITAVLVFAFGSVPAVTNLQYQLANQISEEVFAASVELRR